MNYGDEVVFISSDSESESVCNNSVSVRRATSIDRTCGVKTGRSPRTSEGFRRPEAGRVSISKASTARNRKQGSTSKSDFSSFGRSSGEGDRDCSSSSSSDSEDIQPEKCHQKKKASVGVSPFLPSKMQQPSTKLQSKHTKSHKKLNKTWSQIQKELAYKKAAGKLEMLQTVTATCSETKPEHSFIFISDDEFSDELPDLDEPLVPVTRLNPLKMCTGSWMESMKSEGIKPKNLKLSLVDGDKGNNKNKKDVLTDIASKPWHRSQQPLTSTKLNRYSAKLAENVNVYTKNEKKKLTLLNNQTEEQEKEMKSNTLFLSGEQRERLSNLVRTSQNSLSHCRENSDIEQNYIVEKNKEIPAETECSSSFMEQSKKSTIESKLQESPTKTSRHFLDAVFEQSFEYVPLAKKMRLEPCVLSEVWKQVRRDPLLGTKDNKKVNVLSESINQLVHSKNETEVSSSSELCQGKQQIVRLLESRKQSSLKTSHTDIKALFSIMNIPTQAGVVNSELQPVMSEANMNLIDTCMEEGDKFIGSAMQLVVEHLSQCKPTENIVQKLFYKGLLENNNVYVIFQTYQLLLSLHQKYPSLFIIDWEIVCKIMDNVKGFTKTDEWDEFRRTLALHFLITILENDLLRKDLFSMKEIKKSLAYKILANNSSYSNLQQVVMWINVVLSKEVPNQYLSFQDYPIVNKQLLSLGMQQLLDLDIAQKESQKLLPLLQRLLHIGISVSTSCVACTKRIATELAHVYIYLPDISSKRHLLQTIYSDLLRFKVTQTIIENYCDRTASCAEDFPVSLRNITKSFFKAMPPKTPLTPPLTPSEDDEDMLPSHFDLFSMVPSSSCEELAMLLYYTTHSYLKCAKGKLHEPLFQRFEQDVRPCLSEDDHRELQQFPHRLSALQEHFHDMTSELNSSTLEYLSVMLCLMDIA